MKLFLLLSFLSFSAHAGPYTIFDTFNCARSNHTGYSFTINPRQFGIGRVQHGKLKIYDLKRDFLFFLGKQYDYKISRQCPVALFDLQDVCLNFADGTLVLYLGSQRYGQFSAIYFDREGLDYYLSCAKEIGLF